MKIKKAELSDIPELCLLLDELFSQEVEFEPNREAQAQGLSIIINDPDVGEVMVAWNKSEIIGMVNLLYTISTALGGRVGLIEDMVVSAQGRGMGVGSKLLDQTIELAKDKRCKRITLLTDQDNEGGHRFYERHQFRRSSMVAFRRSLEGGDG